jgi:hypothetical protein
MTTEEIFFPDGHPRPKVTEMVAEQLAKDLSADPVWGPRLGLAR